LELKKDSLILWRENKILFEFTCFGSFEYFISAVSALSAIKIVVFSEEKR